MPGFPNKTIPARPDDRRAAAQPGDHLRQALLDQYTSCDDYGYRTQVLVRKKWQALQIPASYPLTYRDCQEVTKEGTKSRLPNEIAGAGQLDRLRAYVAALEDALRRFGLLFEDQPAAWAGHFIHNSVTRQVNVSAGDAVAVGFFTGAETSALLRIDVAPGGAGVRLLVNEIGGPENEEREIESYWIGPAQGTDALTDRAFDSWDELKEHAQALIARWLDDTRADWQKRIDPQDPHGFVAHNVASHRQQIVDRERQDLATLCHFLWRGGKVDHATRRRLLAICKEIELDLPRSPHKAHQN